MAHHKSAEKRNRQSIKRNLYNRANKKLVKEAVKAVRSAQTADVAKEALTKAMSILDKVAARGVLHKNTAARKKSTLAKILNKMTA